jgi:hypothetical protein
LVDKLDVGVPRNAEYTRGFGKLVAMSMEPDWHRKVWRDGGHYLRRGDFREISGGELPVILHQYNRHDRKAGDKVELVETAGMSISEMNSHVRAVYAVEPMENRVMRLDLAADISDVPVRWFRDHTEFRGKQTNREWAVQSLTKRNAQTLYSGVKPHQLRIYDKTGHREGLWLSEVRKMAKSEREFKLSFEERWGYDRSMVVTRVERQIGGGEVKTFGYSQVGHLYQLEKADPFDQILFRDDVEDWRGELSADDRIGIEWMRYRVSVDGVVNAKAALRDLCADRQKYHRRWSRWKSFVLATESARLVTRHDLLKSYRASVHKQIKLAA